MNEIQDIKRTDALFDKIARQIPSMASTKLKIVNSVDEIKTGKQRLPNSISETMLRKTMKRAEMELYRKGATPSHQLIKEIHPTASDEFEVLISTYMLQLSYKTTLENFLLKELNEKGEE